jgi:hypothetical protein
MKNNPMRTLFRFSVAIVLAIVFVSNLKESAFAATLTTGGVFTDDNDVRWEWKRQFDSETNQEQVSIMYYDRPAEANTITVPSLSDVIAASGASSTLDTYLLENADEEAQETAFAATAPKRDATASVTKLDLTNTSKIQIIGVKPILDPDTEAEIVFGENIVIGDGIDVDRVIEATPCDMLWDDGDQVYYCSPNWNNLVRVEDLSSLVNGWNFLSNYEKMTHAFTPEDLGYTSLTGQLEQD